MRIFSSILHLLRSSCPTAILWPVIAIVIFSINRMSMRRPAAHVRYKILEATSPPATYLNPSASIVLKTDVMRVVAATFHCIPCAVFWPSFANASCGMCRRAQFGQLPIQASATFCDSLAQGIAAHNLVRTACAPTFPMRSPITGWIRRAFDYRKSAEYSSTYIVHMEPL